MGVGVACLLPVIVLLPSSTLTPSQTIGGAATTIQWCACDVETFASWTGAKRTNEQRDQREWCLYFGGILLLVLQKSALSECLIRGRLYLIRRTAEILLHPNRCLFR